MKKNRILTVAIMAGVLITAITFLTAARMTGDDGKTVKDQQKIISQVKTGSKGVVVFGTLTVDNGPGLLPLYPETFPQPCKVKKVLVAEGQTVTKNQKLVEFDTKLADLTIAEAKAGLAQAEAALKGADAAVHMADQTMEGHQVLIKATQETIAGKALELEAAKVDLLEVRRKLEGVGVKAESDAEYRSSQKKVDAAEKALEGERVKLEGMKAITPVSKREQAQAAVAEAKAAIIRQKTLLDKANYGLELMTLTAPDDGKIVRSLVAEGLMFGAQTRQPAFLFQPKGPLVVRAEVDQEFASRVVRGQEAIIQDDGNPNLKWNGRVLRVSDSFLPKRATTSAPDGLMVNDACVLECIISIEGNDAHSILRIGQRIKVSIGVE